jgi:alpha-tubulin suppressor-like RCC1 family protein
MQLNEKKYIFTYSPIFNGICIVISAVFSQLIIFIRKSGSIKGNICKKKPTLTTTYSFKHNKGEQILLNKELNTATVYINHNLVYAASACRLHPGPTLYTHHTIWRTTQGGN